MNIDQLQRIAPKVTQYFNEITDAMSRFAIAPAAAEAAFLAQMLHESGNFSCMRESFNYSPANLIATFNRGATIRFTPSMAEMYGRSVYHPADQEQIANIAYANRLGNGSIASGDGWRFRGRGPGQLTGRANYEECGHALGLDLIGNPDQVATVKIGCLAFAWFWAMGNKTGRSLNCLAVENKIDALSGVVNGGENGRVERLLLTQRAMAVMT